MICKTIAHCVSEDYSNGNSSPNSTADDYEGTSTNETDIGYDGETNRQINTA